MPPSLSMPDLYSAAAPIDIARWHFDLQNGHIVSNASLLQMNALYNSTSIDRRVAYGFALRPTIMGDLGAADPLNMSYTLGHQGADYGSFTDIVGYACIAVEGDCNCCF